MFFCNKNIYSYWIWYLRGKIYGLLLSGFIIFALGIGIGIGLDFTVDGGFVELLVSTKIKTPRIGTRIDGFVAE